MTIYLLKSTAYVYNRLHSTGEGAMTEFPIKQLPYNLCSYAGLAFIGKYLKPIKLNTVLDRPFPLRSGVENSGVLKSYLEHLCLSKNDFDALEVRFPDQTGHSVHGKLITQSTAN